MTLGSAKQTPARSAPALDLSAAAALWGGLYVISAATFEAIPPVTLTLVRLGLGVAVLLAFGRLRGVSIGWSDVPHRAAWIAAFVAATSMLLQFGGTALTSGVEGSVVTMATPIFVLLFGRLLDGVVIPRRAWGGIALAVAGVLLLSLRGSGGSLNVSDPSRLLGMLALIGAGATWALYSSLGRPLVAAIGASRAIGLTAALALVFITPVAVVELLMAEERVSTLLVVLIAVIVAPVSVVPVVPKKTLSPTTSPVREVTVIEVADAAASAASVVALSGS